MESKEKGLSAVLLSAIKILKFEKLTFKGKFKKKVVEFSTKRRGRRLGSLSFPLRKNGLTNLGMALRVS